MIQDEKIAVYLLFAFTLVVFVYSDTNYKFCQDFALYGRVYACPYHDCKFDLTTYKLESIISQ